MSSTTPADQRPAERRPIGFWLKLVDRLIDEGFDAVLGDAGLTRRHWQVLNLLQTEPATLQRIDTQLAPFLRGAEATTRPSPMTWRLAVGSPGPRTSRPP